MTQCNRYARFTMVQKQQQQDITCKRVILPNTYRLFFLLTN
jgi:hypothetical protein